MHIQLQIVVFQHECIYIEEKHCIRYNASVTLTSHCIRYNASTETKYSERDLAKRYSSYLT